jgi:glycogen debranching enzyme
VFDNIRPENVPEFHRGDTVYVPVIERPHPSDYDRFIFLIDVFRQLRYDPAALLTQSPFLVQDVLFNSILYRADEDLHALAKTLGEPVEEIEGWLSRMRINFDGRFWDERASLYRDFDLRLGDSIRVNTAAAFLPLFAGLPSEQQAQLLVESHLLNPDEYALTDEVRHWVVTTSRTEPAWEPRRYWRGPVWVILNWFVVEGLLRYGYEELATAIRQDTLSLIEASGFREYYDPRDGSGCGSTDFSWSAALAIELINVGPG